MFNFKPDIQFINYFRIFIFISLILIIISIGSIFYKGLNFGVDFKGGTLIELRVENTEIGIGDVRQSFIKMNLGDVNVKKFGKENDFLIKFEGNDKNKENFVKDIKIQLSKDIGNNFSFRRVEDVGPKVSGELLRSGLIAIVLSLSAMLIYIWIRFEWQFSLGAIIALVHDVIVTIGFFSILEFEINLSIVAAVLTIVGYSMNDTVVIFDRVRENLKKYTSKTINEISNLSINETLSRTIITSLTTLLALLSIFFFGGEILKGFSFAMILGVIFGTYSSIFIANPILIKLKVNQKSVLKGE
ncbi:MAG: protein translocase subunit SecF [Candidatus Pelagibacter sp.]|jgi:preprotein translocase SecF subunit|nr:protein translocase subunit SecF [Candidatus Pelagibacter sp.]MDP6440333.1 protein translocase subunit SecF [Pelagibacteraceae bacterium]|tara:strand:+ start:13910 stop:14812 length:903 start_codon:yes stop_codon:yes gene_type:complete